MAATAYGGTIGFMGAGAMAEALARGFVRNNMAQFGAMHFTDPSPERQEAFSKLGANRCEDNDELARKCDTLIVAVKPGMVGKVLRSIHGRLTPQHRVISVAAGVSLASIEEACAGKPRVVRVMPNTPAFVGRMAGAMARGTNATDDDVEAAKTLLGALGEVHLVDEKAMEAVTGVSGSGPAYLFMAMEAMAEGAVAEGLPRGVAQRLAAETVAGAGLMAAESGKHPAQLKDDVCSPGGATAAAVQELERNGFRSSLIEAVRASSRRASQLGH